MELRLNPKERRYIAEALSIYRVDGKMSDSLIKKIEKSMKPIKVSSAKNKGRDLQYTVCTMIADRIGETFDQSDDESPIQSRPMGQHSVDVILRGDARRKFPFSIECKAQENLSIPDWVHQARENQLEGTDWMLVFKKQSLGSKPIVCLDFDVFLENYCNSKDELL